MIVHAYAHTLCVSRGRHYYARMEAPRPGDAPLSVGLRVCRSLYTSSKRAHEPPPLLLCTNWLRRMRAAYEAPSPASLAAASRSGIGDGGRIGQSHVEERVVPLRAVRVGGISIATVSIATYVPTDMVCEPSCRLWKTCLVL